MTKRNYGPSYQADIEPTHDSQPTGATIVWLVAFAVFSCAVLSLVELGRIVSEVLTR